MQTPIGYFGTLLVEMFTCGSYIVMDGSIILLFVSICLYQQAFSRRFQKILQKLDRPEEKSKVSEILGELIYFHNSVKE